MKRENIIIILILLVNIGILQAQDTKYKNYDWVQDPKLHTLTSHEKGLDELILKEKHCAEFIYGDKGELLEYKLYHKIIRVNSSAAIEAHNKIYIPRSLDGSFIQHKVRVIGPKGKIMVLSDKNIKEAVDEDSKLTFRYFALEGLEAGSEIEHFYFLKKSPRYTGIREVLQSEVFKKNVEFELISPSNLIFKAKSYNGLPELKKDTSDTKKNILFVKMDSIPLLKEELMSSYRASLQYVIYKLDRNFSNNRRDFVSYSQISENIYKNIMEVDGSAGKKLKKLTEKLNIKFAVDEEDKLRTIEHYLKSNFSKIDNDSEGLQDLSTILDKKIANETGMVKLFSAVLKQLGISHQVVLTCNREELKFDPDFEAYTFLNDYLVYIPSLNMYLDPTNPLSCLGFVSSKLTHNYGLFIKEVNLGDYNSGAGKVKFIDAVSYDKSYDNLDAKIDFKEEIVNPQITIERKMSGYYAQYFQPFYSFYTPEDKTKTNSLIMKDFIPNVEIKDIQVENEGRDFFGRKPFIVKSSLKDETLVQKAGNKYLFKVGEIIGRQMEMYQKEERKTEVENDFNRLYHRVISFNIPAGYKIANPEVLNMDVYKEDNGERVTAFTSKLTVKDGICTVDVQEFYKKINFGKNEFESFRKVINAAADFNKITIIFQKI